MALLLPWTAPNMRSRSNIILCTCALHHKSHHHYHHQHWGVSKRGVYCHPVTDSWMRCSVNFSLLGLTVQQGSSSGGRSHNMLSIIEDHKTCAYSLIIVIIFHIQFGGGSGRADAYSGIFPPFFTSVHPPLPPLSSLSSSSSSYFALLVILMFF